MASFKDMFGSVKGKLGASSAEGARGSYSGDDYYDEDEYEYEDEYDSSVSSRSRHANSYDSRTSSSGLDSLFSSTQDYDSSISSEVTAQIDMPDLVDVTHQSYADIEEPARSTRRELIDMKDTPKPARSAQKTRAVAVVVPENYEEAGEVAEALQAGSAIILDMRATEVSLKCRFLDFSFGATAALGGHVDVIDNGIYGITTGSAISASELERVKSQGLL